MIDLIKKLYEVSGKESKKITIMLMAEVCKGIFEGITLGAVLLSLLKICDDIFQNKSITGHDIMEVFLIISVSIVGRIVSAYIADKNKNIASYHMGAENRSLLKAFGQGKQEEEHLFEVIHNNRKGFLEVEKTLAPSQFLYLLIFKLGTCVIILTSLFRYTASELTIEKTIILVTASFMVFGGFEMAGSMQGVRGVAMQNLSTIIGLRNIATIEEGNKEQFMDSNIEIEDITFAYEKEPVMKDLSFSFKNGTTTAIIGPSGSGKTTLCHLIARFWDIQSGKIMISGNDVREYRYDSLLSNITMVFQDVYLFADTIRNNIKFGNPNATEEEIIEISKKACCHEFIMNLPEGYDTILEENGASLSGGERQRISIARALLKECNLVILDEATSSVDPENEEKLMVAIKELLKNKTAIIIAHRLNTIREADHIIVMDHGNIVQAGQDSIKNILVIVTT